MRELTDLLAGRSDRLELDQAALLLATIEYPSLDIPAYLKVLDGYADQVRPRIPQSMDGRAFVREMNRFLFDELGFHGNEQDYYNPLNSCLNEVINLRTGIPITLSVLYMELGRRIGRPIRGIGLPGHFVIRYEDQDFSTFIDPFHRGRQVTLGECFELAREVTHGVPVPNPKLLAPVSKQQIVRRMINNLRGIYFARGAYRKAEQVLDLTIEADPRDPELRKQRALILLNLDKYREARGDLEAYLQLQPEAEDAEEIREQILTITHRLARLN